MLPKVAPWTRPVTDLPGVGPARARLLERLGISTVGDVLLHLPRAYQQFVRYRSLHHVLRLPDGAGVLVQGHIEQVSVQRLRSRRYVALETAVLSDETGRLQMRWFVPYRGPLPKPRFRIGQEVVVQGFLGTYGATRTLDDAALCDVDDRASQVVLPVYPLTKGISQRFLRCLVDAALQRRVGASVAVRLMELPKPYHVTADEILGALELIHRPHSLEEAELGRRVLALYEICELVRKNSLAAHGPRLARALPHTDGRLVQRFLAALPYQPTGAQQRVMDEIRTDMSAPRGMRRVLSGDVGSGKSLIIAYALLKAVEAGGQGLLLVPTRVLAAQHVETLQRLYAGLDIAVALFTGEVRADERRLTLERLKAGEIDVLVGTHAALDPSVQFQRLVVGVIDEQHRFGAAQRVQLEEKKPWHALWVSATPIPKTMSQILYGAVPVSYLDERPPGRKPVETRWLSYTKRNDVYAFVDREVRSGGQAYVICPAIEEDEEAGVPGAVQVYEWLLQRPPGGKAVALVHGRMPADEQDRALVAFLKGQAGTLVATSMVEVGVDVPNATVIVIEGAERFGLAQLHQLRGRVGRGSRQSYALLLSDAPTQLGRERLSLLRNLNDGFRLAEEDLRLRGPGEFYGLRQSGATDLRFVDLGRDLDLFQAVMVTAGD